MADNKTGNGQNNGAHAPYNFIPFEEKTVVVAKEDDLIKHDRFLDKKASEEVTYKTGKITYQLINKTELFIGGNTQEGRKELFFGDENHYIIPGSTIRGLVRANAQTLSFSYPSDIEDRSMMYRSFADKCVAVRKEYMNHMRGNDERTVTSFHQSIKAGYLFWENEHKLCIVPAPEFKGRGRNFVKVHESDLRNNRVFSDERYYMYTKPIRKFRDCSFQGRTLYEKQKEYKQGLRKFKKEKYAPYGNQPFLNGGQSIRFTYEEKKITKLKEGFAKGYLFNSQWIDGKVNHYLINVLEKKDLKDAKNKLEIAVDKIISYEKDLERNKQQNKSLAEMDYFYNLPYENGKRAIGVKHARIFFYRTDRDGNVTDFGPTPYFRNFYENTIGAGIQQEIGEDEFDYVSSLFGFVGQGEATHYEGRLNFMNCTLSRLEEREMEQRPLVLMSPKPTAFQLYLQQDSTDPRFLKTYNAKDMCLRGRKFYWKREKVVKLAAETKASLTTKICPLKEGQIFKGEIYFENLTEAELGLILAALQWKEGASDLLGHGKPYGYGKIQISNIHVFYEDKKKSFLNLESTYKAAFLEDTAYTHRELKEKIGSAVRDSMYSSMEDGNAILEMLKDWIMIELSETEETITCVMKYTKKDLSESIYQYIYELKMVEEEIISDSEKEERIEEIWEICIHECEKTLYEGYYAFKMEEKVDQLREQFKADMNGRLKKMNWKKNYTDQMSIKIYDKLSTMNPIKSLDTSYMELKEFKDRIPLPTAQKILYLEEK